MCPGTNFYNTNIWSLILKLSQRGIISALFYKMKLNLPRKVSNWDRRCGKTNVAN